MSPGSGAIGAGALVVQPVDNADPTWPLFELLNAEENVRRFGISKEGKMLAALDMAGLNINNVDVITGGNNSIEFADSGGNVVLNLDTGKVFAIGNLSGAGIHIYLPTTFQGGVAVSNLKLGNVMEVDGKGIKNSAAADLVLYSTGTRFSGFYGTDGATKKLGYDASGDINQCYKTLEFSDGANLKFGTAGAGTKIGVTTNDKIGFWNATPVVQPTGIADADGTLADITTKFNSLLSKLETIGILAVA
jgi:hypothetical protein